jgi:hypothetical protein
MISQRTLLALALLSGSIVEGKRNIAGQQNNARGLSIDEFMKVFDQAVSNMRGNKTGRKLQRMPIYDGSSETKGTLEITEESVRQIFSELTKGKDGQKGAYDSCEDLFQAHDFNGDGLLDLYELIALFEGAGFTTSLATLLAEALLDWYDEDGDAGLGPEELEAACKGGKFQIENI